MLFPRISRLALAVLAVGLAAGTVQAAPAAKKEPPSCAAISFRPVASGMPDGEHDAGLYKSRFGKIELKANVQGGEARDYYMTINNVRPQPLPGGVPKGVEACLKSKHVVVPVQSQQGACLGNRFRVVIDRSGSKKVAMLFGLQGDEWHFCNATEVERKG